MLSEARKKQWKNGFKGSTGKKWNLSDENKKNQSLAQSGEGKGYWRGGNNSVTRRKFAPRPKPDRCEVCNEKGKIVHVIEKVKSKEHAQQIIEVWGL
jgi:hypothetical protein